MNADYYITGIGVSQYYHGAQRLGLPAANILKRCGMSPDITLQPMQHTSVDDFERFMLELILESGDDMLGIHIGEQVMPSLYGVLPTVATMAGSGHQAVEAVLKYQALAGGNAGAIRLLDEPGDHLVFQGLMVYPNPVIRRHLAESMAVLLYKLATFISGRQDLKVQEIHFEHASGSDASKAYLDKLLGCPVRYEAPEIRIVAERALLDIPLNAYSNDAMQVAEELARQQLAQQQENQNILQQIKLQIRTLMAGSSPRREIVADRLGISVRTLDRRLAEAGLSWQQLLDGLRAQLAQEFLSDTQLTVQEIACRLGFADARSFQRRFRHWTGKSPSEYRDTRRWPGSSP
ncbi:AraC family transcriptional regulator [Alcanivorax sediminis]|uniref:Helix-turn-helix domain-containing protein n=1 Tax=Alcanivorax sediminis TaxID=2663008 RepID=A0A6N7LQG5_9GAMM|nr:AraC family transcriptional regulator [Alcanivorax sediminis]MQX52262.1 helix-turn-helix domain-containing protein [Alcanivorax sediminis]